MDTQSEITQGVDALTLNGKRHEDPLKSVQANDTAAQEDDVVNPWSVTSTSDTGID